MNPIARTSVTGSLSPNQIADLIQEVYDANGLVAEEVDRLLGSRAAVSIATIDRFTRLANKLRPGASARVELSTLDPSLLLAGTSVWMARRRKAAADTASETAAVWHRDATLGESA